MLLPKKRKNIYLVVLLFWCDCRKKKNFMHRLWICLLFITIAKNFCAIPAFAKPAGYSIVTSDVGVSDSVGGGLLTLTGPSIADPRTMIVVFGGSEGGYQTTKSPLVMNLLLAGHRVAALSYHGATGTPKHLREISIDAVVARIAELSEAGNIPEGCIGIIGTSKGGELALLLASLTNAGDVYVAITPSDVVWQASNPTLRRKSSWTYSGTPLPFIKYPRLSGATMKALLDVGQAGDLHSLALRKAKNFEAARIPIEKATAPILLQAGTQDKLWPTEEMSKRLIARLAVDKPDHDVELQIYEHDHYLGSSPKVRADTLNFLKKHLEKEKNLKRRIVNL